MTTIVTMGGKRALAELSKRVKASTPQGKFENETREQLDEITFENTQAVQALSRKIEATDVTLAHLGPRVEEVAEVVSQLITYLDELVNEQQPDEEKQPFQEDRENVVKETVKAYASAGSPEKRELIWAAFNNSFDPRFYKEGMYKVLWALVEKLEYPHFRVLRMLQKGEYAASAIPVNAEDYFFAKDLAVLGLVREEEIGDGRRRFTPVPVSLRLVEFATPPVSARGAIK